MSLVPPAHYQRARLMQAHSVCRNSAFARIDPFIDNLYAEFPAPLRIECLEHELEQTCEAFDNATDTKDKHALSVYTAHLTRLLVALERQVDQELRGQQALRVPSSPELFIASPPRLVRQCYQTPQRSSAVRELFPPQWDATPPPNLDTDEELEETESDEDGHYTHPDLLHAVDRP